MAAQSAAVNVTGTGTVFSGPCTFRGYSLFSTAGATVTIYDGVTAAGTVLAKFTLAAAGDRSFDLADGVHCALGVHVVTSAAVEGSVRVG